MVRYGPMLTTARLPVVLPGSIELGSYAVDSNSELDRLLAAQADRVNAVTTRSAGLTAAAALAGSFVSAQLTVKIQVRWWVITTFGLATLAGVVVLLGTRLETGPDADKLLEWDLLYPGQFAELVRVAKAIAVGGNESRVRLVDIAFYLQALLVGAAVVVALASIRRG